MTPMHKRSTMGALLLSAGLLLTGCADKPGSAGWCEAQKAIPKGDWTGDDVRAMPSTVSSTPQP